MDRVQLELSLNPAWVWGAAGKDPGAPGDCSGKITAIVLSCGITVCRIDAKSMAAGKCGWNFPLIALQDGKILTLIFFTFKPERPNGHVCIVTYPPISGLIKVAHASKKYGFIEVVIAESSDDPLYPYITTIRQMYAGT